jgi:hypothetical protein
MAVRVKRIFFKCIVLGVLSLLWNLTILTSPIKKEKNNEMS